MKRQDDVYAGVHRVLAVGMVASTALYVVGIAAALRAHERLRFDTGWLREHYHLRPLLRGLAAMEPTSIMLVATVLLILTPVARVLVSIAIFARDGDRKFVLVTTAVAVVMATTVLLSRFGLT